MLTIKRKYMPSYWEPCWVHPPNMVFGIEPCVMLRALANQQKLLDLNERICHEQWVLANEEFEARAILAGMTYDDKECTRLRMDLRALGYSSSVMQMTLLAVKDPNRAHPHWYVLAGHLYSVCYNIAKQLHTPEHCDPGNGVWTNICGEINAKPDSISSTMAQHSISNALAER